MHFAQVLLHLLAPAKVQQRAAAGLVRGNALLGIALRLLLDVERDLAVLASLGVLDSSQSPVQPFRSISPRCFDNQVHSPGQSAPGLLFLSQLLFPLGGEPVELRLAAIL
jgi:hypothetical protein